MMPKDLSGFISRICAEFPDQVVSVRRPIRAAEFEVSAVLQHLDDAGQYPMALDFPPEQSKLPLSLEFARRERQQVTPQVVDAGDAPVKQVVLRGDSIDV